MFLTANDNSVHTVCTVYIVLTKREGCTGRTYEGGYSFSMVLNKRFIAQLKLPENLQE